MNFLSGLFGTIGTNVSGFTQIGASHYGWASGLTQAQMEEAEKADIRKKELQKKVITYTLIIVGIIAIVLIAKFNKKQK